MRRYRAAIILGLAGLLGIGAARADAPADPAAVAAHAAGEPSLQEILDRQGYSINTVKDEVQARLFVRAGAGPVTHAPIAAYGLPQVCTSGWYRPTRDRPDTHVLWQVAASNNKRDHPPLKPGGRTTFDPGTAPFGLWVATAGFPGETVCTEDALQRFVPRFKPEDRHKAHIYPVKRGDKLVPHTYIIGWEYSTNNDDQDMVTLVTNVAPAPPDRNNNRKTERAAPDRH